MTKDYPTQYGIYRYTTDSSGEPSSIHLAEFIPADGMKIYEVAGHYVGLKSQRLIHKYICAKCPKDAKKQYKEIYGWRAVQCAEVTDAETLHKVCTDYNLIP